MKLKKTIDLTDDAIRAMNIRETVNKKHGWICNITFNHAGDYKGATRSVVEKMVSNLTKLFLSVSDYAHHISIEVFMPEPSSDYFKNISDFYYHVGRFDGEYVVLMTILEMEGYS